MEKWFITDPKVRSILFMVILVATGKQETSRSTHQQNDKGDLFSTSQEAKTISWCTTTRQSRTAQQLLQADQVAAAWWLTAAQYEGNQSATCASVLLGAGGEQMTHCCTCRWSLGRLGNGVQLLADNINTNTSHHKQQS